MKIILYILGAILIFFGVLFIWASFTDPFNPGNFFTGLITLAVGFGSIWFAGRRKAVDNNASSEVTVKIDLPGNVRLDTLKCQSCGGVLSPENVKLVAGAPVVNCPYCKTSYQLTEEPKW